MGSISDKTILSNLDENQSAEKRQCQAAKELASDWACGLIRNIATLSINVNAIKNKHK